MVLGVVKHFGLDVMDLSFGGCGQGPYPFLHRTYERPRAPPCFREAQTYLPRVSVLGGNAVASEATLSNQLLPYLASGMRICRISPESCGFTHIYISLYCTGCFDIPWLQASASRMRPSISEVDSRNSCGAHNKSVSTPDRSRATLDSEAVSGVGTPREVKQCEKGLTSN